MTRIRSFLLQFFLVQLYFIAAAGFAKHVRQNGSNASKDRLVWHIILIYQLFTLMILHTAEKIGSDASYHSVSTAIYLQVIFLILGYGLLRIPTGKDKQ